MTTAEATHHIKAPGHSWSGREHYELDGAEYATLDDMIAAARQQYQFVAITPCECTDQKSYYGSGGCRYRHSQRYCVDTGRSESRCCQNADVWVCVDTGNGWYAQCLCDDTSHWTPNAQVEHCGGSQEAAEARVRELNGE